MRWVSFIPARQRRTVLQAAQFDSEAVLIIGDKGSGKSGIARWIHANGPRSAAPLITLSTTEELHPQLTAAGAGTVVVPEFDSWNEADRAVFLSLMKTHSAKIDGPDGSFRKIFPVRMIFTASEAPESHSPWNEILSRFRIQVPALSDRTEEFEDICLGILAEIAHAERKDHLRGIDRVAWSILRAHSWPGNLRELRNVLRFAVVRAEGDRIEAHDLPELSPDSREFHASREEFERAIISELLKTFNGDEKQTSTRLKVDLETLRLKMRQHGITSRQLP